MTTRTERPSEAYQRAADAYIDLAQRLDRAAGLLREQARNYRAGLLMPDYKDLPPEAGDHMRGPVTRAIHGLDTYRDAIQTAYEQVRAALLEYGR